MRRLIFVHGRGQQGREPDALRRRWVAGLSKGLTAAGRDTMDPPRSKRSGSRSTVMCCGPRSSRQGRGPRRRHPQCRPAGGSWAAGRRQPAPGRRAPVHGTRARRAGRHDARGGVRTLDLGVAARPAGVGGQPFRRRRSRHPGIPARRIGLPGAARLPVRGAGGGPPGAARRPRLRAGRPQPRRGGLRRAPGRGAGARPDRGVRRRRGAAGAGRGHRGDAAERLGQADLALDQRLRLQGLGDPRCSAIPPGVGCASRLPSPTPVPTNTPSSTISPIPRWPSSSPTPRRQGPDLTLCCPPGRPDSPTVSSRGLSPVLGKWRLAWPNHPRQRRRTHGGVSILERTGDTVGSAGADDTSRQRPARRPARLGTPPGRWGRNASTASTWR